MSDFVQGRGPSSQQEIDLVKQTVAAYDGPAAISQAYYEPLYQEVPLGNWAEPELILIADVEGDVVQRWKPFASLDAAFAEIGISCYIRIYTLEEAEKYDITVSSGWIDLLAENGSS